MTESSFYGDPLVNLEALTSYLRQSEQVPVEVKLMDARVYPDGFVRLIRHPRRSRGSMNIRGLIAKFRRDYPGLDFIVPVHGRTRIDTVRRRFGCR